MLYCTNLGPDTCYPCVSIVAFLFSATISYSHGRSAFFLRLVQEKPQRSASQDASAPHEDMTIQMFD